MTTDEIKSNLCAYDERNPSGLYHYFKSIGDTDEEIKSRKLECLCDNCFYGRTKLANELLKYINE